MRFYNCVYFHSNWIKTELNGAFQAFTAIQDLDVQNKHLKKLNQIFKHFSRHTGWTTKQLKLNVMLALDIINKLF